MAGIPQVITEDRASGALVIDGSLKFDGQSGGNHGYGHLKRTSSGASGAGTFTISWWAKRGSMRDDWQYMIAGDNGSLWGVGFPGSSGSRDSLTLFNGSHQYASGKFRDNSGWYHIVLVVNANYGPKLWVNGEAQSNTNTTSSWNLNNTMYIGKWVDSGTAHNYDGYLAQYTCIDGLELGPSYFAYNDPLTGTWRPKKFRAEGTTVNDGTDWGTSSESGSGTVNNKSNIFDADPTTAGGSTGANTDITLTLPKSIRVKKSVRIYANQNGTAKINNEDAVTTTSGGAKWITIFDGTTDFSSITLTSTGGDTCDIRAIEVDGVMLESNATQNLAFGNAGFYLPLDGKTPIGKDQSGNGNDWTPVGFGGSVALNNPTVSGAIPILNTNEAGTVAKPGVRTDKKTYTVTEVGGKYYLDGVQQPILNAYRGSSLTFDYTSAGGHPFYLSGMPDGKHNTNAYSVQFDGANGTDLQLANHTDLQVGSESNWTIEFFVRKTGAFADYDVITGKGGSGQFEWFIEGFANGQVRFLYSDNGTSTWTGNHLLLQYMSDNQWYHFAAVRNGTSFKMYVDGIETFSTTGFNIHAGTDALHIGGYGGASGQDPPVQISNYRIVKGTSVYTSNFTRPGTTLGNITNTKLLCCQNSSATTATVSPVSITSNGGVSVIQTHQPFLYIDSEGGVNTATSNTTKITIPHWAADTLYYYCGQHQNMGSSINVTTDILKADPYAWRNVLALPLVDYNVDVSADFSVNSGTKAISIGGDPSSNNRSNFYGGSTYFDGNDTVRLSSTNIPKAGSARTIEFWVWINSGYSSWSNIFSYGGSSASQCFGININNNQNANWAFTGYSGGDFDTGVKVAPYVNKWTHVAVTYSGGGGASYSGDGTLKIYLNGILIGSATRSLNTTGSTFCIGGSEHSGFAENFTGYISDFRVYEGLVKYTENFVVGSTAPDVLPDTPSGVSSKSKLAKITDGGVCITRSSDQYIQATASTDFRLDGQYCIEYFLNLDDYSNDSVYVRTFVLDGPTGDGGSTNIHLNVNPSNGQLLLWSGSGEQISPNAHTYVGGGWHHVCVTRDSSNRTRMFIDGVLGNWSDINTDYNLNSGQNRPRLGALGSTGGTTGHYSNFRIIKGSIPTEYQTSTSTNGTKVFDPPTEALTTTSQGATANDVKLIACQSITEPGRAAVSPSISGANDGTQWSHYVTGDIDSSNPGYQAFDGNTSNVGCRTINAGGASIAWHPPSPIAFSSSFKIYCAKDGTDQRTRFLVVHAGGTTDFSDSVVTSTTQTAVDLSQIAGVTSPISKIAIVSGGANPRFSAIEVDNTILVDPVSPIGGSAATNFNPFTDDINTIRGQESGYATLNPLASASTLSDGNLTMTSGASWGSCLSTISFTGGKYYWETYVVSSNYSYLGVSRSTHQTSQYPSQNQSWALLNNGYCYYDQTGSDQINVNTGTTVPAEGTVGTAVDADSGKIWWSVNGVWIGGGVPNNGNGIFSNIPTNESLVACVDVYSNTATMNFGQKPFKFPPPDGFQPLSLSNLQPEKVIARPDKYAAATTYTGNGATKSVNVGHKPDFVWIKNRDDSTSHMLFDSVRGVQKVIYSNANTQEQAAAISVTSFDSNGFTVSSANEVNGSGDDMVSWSWKAGGNKNTFNVDDVGYANASDVNMSVGSLNNDAYDQRETWSNGVTSSSGAWPGGYNTACGAVTNGFNGDTSNGVCATASASIVWNNPQTTSTLSGKLEFYNRSDTTTYSRRIIIVHAGGTSGRITLTPNSSWQDLGTYTNITSIIVTGDNPGGGVIDAIKVDGKLLVDAGASVTNVPSIANIGASIGTRQGFSIIKYAGSGSNGTIAHGLSQAPDFFFGRDLEDTSTNRDWIIYHKSIGATGRVKFTTGAESISSAFFQDTSPTDSVISVGTSNDVNSSNDYILYCWHDVPGLQKFGSYINPSSTDGAFVEVGFKPAILIYKCVRNISSSSGAGDWMIIDTTRNPVNNPSDNNTLVLNVNNAEDNYYTASQAAVDILSNGFKIRHPNSSPGGDPGRLYIYAAWAEAPAVNLYGGQSNAR